jgi:hypothetical protein
MDSIIYGWYSQTQKDNNKYKIKDGKQSYSSYIYLKEDGSQVEVTEITRTDQPNKNFKDVVFKVQLLNG